MKRRKPSIYSPNHGKANYHHQISPTEISSCGITWPQSYVHKIKNGRVVGVYNSVTHAAKSMNVGYGRMKKYIELNKELKGYYFKPA